MDHSMEAFISAFMDSFIDAFVDSFIDDGRRFDLEQAFDVGFVSNIMLIHEIHPRSEQEPQIGEEWRM